MGLLAAKFVEVYRWFEGLFLYRQCYAFCCSFDLANDFCMVIVAVRQTIVHIERNEIVLRFNVVSLLRLQGSFQFLMFFSLWWFSIETDLVVHYTILRFIIWPFFEKKIKYKKPSSISTKIKIRNRSINAQVFTHFSQRSIGAQSPSHTHSTDQFGSEKKQISEKA